MRQWGRFCRQFSIEIRAVNVDSRIRGSSGYSQVDLG
jgi:hypothetical protein